MEKFSNLVTAFAALALIVAAGFYVDSRLDDRQVARYVPTPVRVGQNMNLPQTLGRTSLVLELSSSCSHCVANVPLYRSLMAHPQIKSGAIQVIVVMISDNRQAARDFTTRAGLPEPAIVIKGNAFASFPIYLTPTLLFVNPQGVITDAWVGELRGQDIESFFAKVG
jgi:hypothetical protein